MSCTLSIGSTELVKLAGLLDTVTGDYVNTATVSGALLDAARTTTLTTFSMPYVAATDGDYEGTISAVVTAALTSGTSYQVRVTATSGGNVRVFWEKMTALHN